MNCTTFSFQKRRHCEISDSEESLIKQCQREDLQLWTQRNWETYDKVGNFAI